MTSDSAEVADHGVSQLATAHGTKLGIEEKFGAIRTVAKAVDGLRPIFAWIPRSVPNLCFLITQDAQTYPIIDGDEFRGGPLSYFVHSTEPGTFALCNPSTGKFFTYQIPDSAVSEGIGTGWAETLQGAGRLKCEPSPGALNIVPPVCLTTLDTSPGGILSLDGILDLAAEADPAQIGVIASLLRLLTEDVLRLLVAELARCPVYPQLFEYLRQHLGKQAPFLWGTTTDIALDFWIRNCGYEVGRHTYGAPTIWSGLLFKETTKLTIGKYCAIAGNIDLVMANHRTRWVSTYPFAILRSFWPGFDGTESDYVAKPIVIGNDVWIGAHCCILPGSQVGDGAVLAAYSQVRGVVPPYAIYSGNPGRVVGYRFSESIIARLLAIRWWNWPDWKVDAFLPLMMSADIQRFIDAAEADVAGHAPHETAAPRPLANTPPNAAEDPLAAIGAVARRLQDYGDPAMREIGHALVMIQLQLAGLQPRGGGLFRFWRRQRRN